MTAYSNICGQGLEFKVLRSSRLPSHSQIYYFSREKHPSL